MKTRFVATSLLLCLFSSCIFYDDTERLEAFGVVINDSGIPSSNRKSRYILSDEGKKLFPDWDLYEYIGSRVWIIYNIDSESKPGEQDIILQDMVKLREIQLQTGVPDTLRNEKTGMRKVWIAHNYLTIDLDVAANSSESIKKHVFAVYSDKTVKNDTVYMELRHDMKGDDGYNFFRTGLAINLPEQGINKNIVISFKYLDSNNEQITKHLTYKPAAIGTTVKPEISYKHFFGL